MPSASIETLPPLVSLTLPPQQEPAQPAPESAAQFGVDVPVIREEKAMSADRLLQPLNPLSGQPLVLDRYRGVVVAHVGLLRPVQLPHDPASAHLDLLLLFQRHRGHAGAE